MKVLLRLIAAGLARLIESGSPVGALVGCLIGIATGGALAYFIIQSIAGIVPLVISGALVGAIAGSRIGSKPSPNEPWNTGRPLRISNINTALAPGAILIILGIGFTLAVLFAPTKDSSNQTDKMWALATGGIALLGLIVAAFPRLWIEVGDQVQVHRLFGREDFPWNQIVMWGFETGRGDYNKNLPAGPTLFHIEFKSGVTFEAPITPEKARRFIDVVARAK